LLGKVLVGKWPHKKKWESKIRILNSRNAPGKKGKEDGKEMGSELKGQMPRVSFMRYRSAFEGKSFVKNLLKGLSPKEFFFLYRKKRKKSPFEKLNCVREWGKFERTRENKERRLLKKVRRQP